MYVEFLNSIVARLREINPAAPAPAVVVVDPLPNTEADFKRPTPDALPRIVVALMGSDFGKVESTDIVNQEETIKFALVVSARSLYGQNSVYQALELAKLKLVGFEPTSPIVLPNPTPNAGKKIQLREISPASREDNIWSVELHFSCRHRALEFTADSNDPLLQQIIINPPTIN